MPKRSTNLDEITADLYSMRPAEFTAARNARARDAKASGDTELADALHGLRKPSTSAWLANLLARDASPEVARLFQLGDALREAQAGFDADALRRLSRERHDVVEDLTRRAVQLAADRGEKSVGASARQELEGTLEAALFEQGAAEELRRGCLVSALSYSGLGFPSTAGTATERVASHRTARSGSAKSAGNQRLTLPRSPKAKRSTSAQDTAAARERARRDARDARAAAKRAEDALSGSERALARARAALVEAEAEMGRRRAAARQAEQDVKRARGERDRTAQDVRRAERQLEAEDR